TRPSPLTTSDVPCISNDEIIPRNTSASYTTISATITISPHTTTTTGNITRVSKCKITPGDSCTTFSPGRTFAVRNSSSSPATFTTANGTPSINRQNIFLL